MLSDNPGGGLNEILSSSSFFPASVLDIAQAEDALSSIPDSLIPARDWSVSNTEIRARAAICVETGTGAEGKILFSKDDEDRLPIASLTKLMSALVILDNYNLEKVTIISKEAVDQIGNQGSLSEGEILSLDSLLHVALIESSNDAIYSLAEVIGEKKFVELMNQRAEELGLLGTSFSDSSGLNANNYSTARDLVKLAEYILENRPEIWDMLSLSSYKVFTPGRKIHHIAVNTNELLGEVPNIVGGKTGKTLEAKGCLLLITENKENQKKLVYVLLGSSDRFGEMRNFINWITQAYKW